MLLKKPTWYSFKNSKGYGIQLSKYLDLNYSTNNSDIIRTAEQQSQIWN